MNNKIVFIIIAIVFVIFGCTGNTKAIKENEHIYIVGQDLDGEFWLDDSLFYFLSDAVYWLNGEKHILPKTGRTARANAIAFLNSDIYIVGNNDDDAVYWLNGQRHILPRNPDGRNYLGFGLAEACAITFSGSDVYIAGRDFGDPVYWLNGERHVLPRMGVAEVFDIGILNSDLFIVGYDEQYDGNINAVYWLNGKMNILPKESDRAIANAIAFLGSDVYIVGFDGDEAVYWLNENRHVLSKGRYFPQANSIVISDSDVYIAGRDDDGAVYWINGNKHILEVVDFTISVAANSITFFGSNVYIAGIVEDDTGNVPCYWKNNQLDILPKQKIEYSSSRVSANSIIVF